MRILVLLLFVGIMSCQPVSIPTESEVKIDVHSLLDDWHKAASEANYDNYFGKMDSISIFIGTDASENWTKSEFEAFSKPYFDNGKAWDFRVLERNVYMNSDRDVVWFDELLKTWMGTCRGSGVVVKSETDWKIKHYVLSLTIPNDDIQKVIAATKERDSVFQSNFLK